jgi:hypothetical protein
VPSGWYIDHFPTDRDGRTRSYLPGSLGTEFEQPVVLCQDRFAIPPSVDPNSLVRYHCLAEGTGTEAPLSVRMINILALGSLLEIHMRILDEDSRFTFGTKRIASISNTTIPNDLSEMDYYFI